MWTLLQGQFFKKMFSCLGFYVFSYYETNEIKVRHFYNSLQCLAGMAGVEIHKRSKVNIRDAPITSAGSDSAPINA